VRKQFIVSDQSVIYYEHNNVTTKPNVKEICMGTSSTL